jgi:hypothetical protein
MTDIEQKALASFALELLEDQESISEDSWEAAIKHGLVIGGTVTEPCGQSCHCAAYFVDMDEGVECFCLAPFLIEAGKP